MSDPGERTDEPRLGGHRADGGPMSDLDQLRARIDATCIENQLLVLLHRWYCYYELEPDQRQRVHQRELITEDFELTRPPEGQLPDVSGADAYLDSVESAFPGQRNAHHLRSLAVRPAGPGRWAATDTHDFQAQGPALTGAALLRYDLEMVSAPGEWLPRLSRLREQILSRSDDPFRAALPINRASATQYAWLVLLEGPGSPPAGARDLVADDVTLELSAGTTVTGAPDVVSWLAAQQVLLERSCHHPIDLSVTEVIDGYQLTVRYEWEGIAATGQPMVATTRHRWRLREGFDRYPRVASMEVTAEQPFTPVDAGEALEHHRSASTP